MTGALDKLRDGGWRRVDGGPLAAAATGAVALDVVTTHRILATPSYEEFNAVVAGVGGGDPALGAAYLALQGGALAALTWLSLGWLSTFCATFALASHGLGGGLSNLLLFAGGEGLYGHLPVAGSAAYALPDLLGVVAGLAVAAAADGSPPAAEAVPVVAWFLGGVALSAGVL